MVLLELICIIFAITFIGQAINEYQYRVNEREQLRIASTKKCYLQDNK